MEPSYLRHLFYFNDEPLDYVEQLFKVKHLSFTRINSTDLDCALDCVKNLSQAVLANPNMTKESIGYLCFGNSSKLTYPLQQLGFNKILLINPITQEFFDRLSTITQDTTQDIAKQIKLYLENLD